MANLPRAARIYLVAVWSCAILIVSACLLTSSGLTIHVAWFALWFIAFALADYFLVTFDLGGGNVVAISLAETIFLFLIAIAGVEGVLVIIAGTMTAGLLHHRPWYRVSFNASQRAIAYILIYGMYTLLQNPAELPYGGAQGILVFLSVAFVFHASSTILVGTMMALISHQRFGTVYRSAFETVRWVHLLSLPLGALMAALWDVDRWMVIFGCVSLVIAQRAFAAMAQLHVELQRNQELAAERERLLEELKAQQEELIRASKLAALGTFASGIAHEFNNLLTVVLGQAQIGLITDDQEEMRESLDRTIKACRRGRSITQGLLTFARQGETQRVMTQLREIIDDTVDMIEHDFEKEHVRIVREFQAVPPTYCDPGQIVQVLLNMLTNARDAMHDQGGGTITLTMRHENAQIVLLVADTGSGIPPEVQQQIFQPFVTTKGTRGTGLGLAICYGIIESHNGSIQVASTLGHGTTMTIRLPIIERYEPAIRMSSQDESRLTAATSSEHMRIYSDM